MESNQFNYTYSSDKQSEVKRIREKYLDKQPDKMEQLRKLDKKASAKASTVSLILGIIGTLILGVGMCCTMVWMGKWFVPGIIIGLIGIGIAAISYPLYTKIAKKEREKIAPEIIKLTDELMQ